MGGGLVWRAILAIVLGSVGVLGLPAVDHGVRDVAAQAAPSISMIVDPGTAVPGSHLSYLITVSNAGPVGVTVNDQVPGEIVDVSWGCSTTNPPGFESWSCSPWTGSGNAVQIQASDDSGGSIPIYVGGTLGAGAQPGTAVTNQVCATWEDVPDPVCDDVTFIVAEPPPAATVTPTNTPAPTGTSTPTETPAPSATSTATATATATATMTTTPQPTATGTLEPTATTVPTETPEPTATPTQMPSTGTAAITVQTSDGGDVPDGAEVCVGESCQTIGDLVSAAAESPTTLTFADLPAGTPPLTVTGTAPYGEFAGDVTIVAGETAEETVTLARAQPPTVAPPTATTVPPTSTVPPPPTATKAAGVAGLPNTGAGRSTGGGDWALLVALGLVALAAINLAWRRRTA